jgi:hypothetical protein
MFQGLLLRLARWLAPCGWSFGGWDEHCYGVPQHLKYIWTSAVRRMNPNVNCMSVSRDNRRIFWVLGHKHFFRRHNSMVPMDGATTKGWFKPHFQRYNKVWFLSFSHQNFIFRSENITMINSCFDCAVALCTMQDALFVFFKLTWIFAAQWIILDDLLRTAQFEKQTYNPHGNCFYV